MFTNNFKSGSISYNLSLSYKMLINTLPIVSPLLFHNVVQYKLVSLFLGKYCFSVNTVRVKCTRFKILSVLANKL